MTISINALQLALKALQREIDHYTALANDAATSDEQAETHGAYVLDLMAALSEIGDLYERSRAATPTAPPLEQLLERR